MIIEFSVGNYLSFKNIVTISLVSSSIKEHQSTHVFQYKNLKLLKNAVIYGANASGKTNLFSALAFMKDFVMKSAIESQAGEEIAVQKFRLSTESDHKPSYFEVIFFQNGTRYRYGFQVNEERVCAEWLYSATKHKESELFYREFNNIVIKPSFKEGKDLESRTRENALFLSVVAQFNGKIANEVLNWFDNLYTINGVRNSRLKLATKWIPNLSQKEALLNFMKIADLGIEDLSIKQLDLDESIFPEDIPSEVKNIILDINRDILFSHHKKYDESKNVVGLEAFPIESTESEGTIKLLSLAVPIIDTLQHGKVLFIDELDAKLHPLMTRSIINLFNSDLNQMNAQLIFATHDTTNLSNRFFRRDQVWFIEKDKYGCSDLYSLVEYRIEEEKVRKDASYEKEYINGKYGAIPFLGDFYSLLEDIDGNRQYIQKKEGLSKSSEESRKPR